MAIISFPYDSQVVDGKYDRAIKSATYRQLLSKYFTTGVFPNPSTQCQVYPSTGMKVSVRKGSANINGLYVELEGDVEATIEQADTQGRYDRIVLRHDDNNNVRATNVVVIKGTAGASPQAPSLTRNETVYDICLATVYVRARATSISASDITDTRLNTDLCGIVSATITSIDTTTFYNQIQADLLEFKTKEQAEFEEFSNTQEQAFLNWFEGIKGILGKDEAGNLLNLIQENQANIEKLQYTGNIVSGETFSGKASNKGVKLHKVVGKSGNVVITEIYSNGETGTNTETKTNTVKTSLTLSEGDIYEDGIITRADGTTEILNIPTIPSFYPNTNVWTDNTVSTDIEWEVLSEADNSLEIEEVETELNKVKTELNTGFKLIASSYGFDVYGCKNGLKGMIYIVGDSLGAVTEHKITLPEKWNVDSYYNMITFVSNDVNKPCSVTFYKTEITLNAYQFSWTNVEYVNLVIPVGFSNSNI